MSLVNVMNPIQICLGITYAPVVSYDYIMLQAATVNNFRRLSKNVVEIKQNVLFIHLLSVMHSNNTTRSAKVNHMGTRSERLLSSKRRLAYVQTNK